MTEAEVREFLDDVLEEEALVLDGLAETHGVSDRFVRQLFRSLEAIRAHAIERLEGVAGSPSPGAGSSRPRPAVEEFLAKLGRS
ncbi:MAG: hypothetical protein U0167_19625 [bacterium]